MNKELSELNIIRLQTELENCIGFREHYLKHYRITGNNILFEYYDTLLDEIITEIIELGNV
jgi:hypothetical protein